MTRSNAKFKSMSSWKRRRFIPVLPSPGSPKELLHRDVLLAFKFSSIACCDNAAVRELIGASGHTSPTESSADPIGQGFNWTRLRRGMRDAQRNGACDGNRTEMGGLHQKGEPDTFYCSHRCL